MKNVPKMILCEQVKKWFESTVHTVHKKNKPLRRKILTVLIPVLPVQFASFCKEMYEKMARPSSRVARAGGWPLYWGQRFFV